MKLTYHNVFACGDPIARNFDGHPCEIIRALDRTECDIENDPMFVIRFEGKYAYHAFGDELFVQPEKRESIYTLWQNVREHPDFAGGAIFTREDVADAVFEPENGWEDYLTADDIARATDEMCRTAAEVIDNYIFNGAYSWRDALRDNIEA